MLYVGYEHSIDNQREDRFLFRGLRTKAKEDNIASQSGLQFSQRLMNDQEHRPWSQKTWNQVLTPPFNELSNPEVYNTFPLLVFSLVKEAVY